MKKYELRVNGINSSISFILLNPLDRAEVEEAIEESTDGKELAGRFRSIPTAVKFEAGRETISYFTLTGEDHFGNRHILKVYR